MSRVNLIRCISKHKVISMHYSTERIISIFYLVTILMTNFNILVKEIPQRN